MNLYGLEFLEITPWVPEQYDVTNNGETVAYVRLRHGDLTVEMPDVGGKEILRVTFGEEYPGFNDEDRAPFLDVVARLIVDHLKAAS